MTNPTKFDSILSLEMQYYLHAQGFVASRNVVIGALGHCVALRQAVLDILVGGGQSVRHFAQLCRHLSYYYKLLTKKVNILGS